MDKKRKGGKYKDTARNLVVVVSLVLIVGVVASVTLAQGTSIGFWDNVSEKLSSKLFGSMEVPEMEDLFGASGSRFKNGLSADSISPNAGQVRGTTFTATGAATIGGTLGLSGALTGTSAVFSGSVNALESATTSIGIATIAALESGRVTYLTGTGAAITLPDAAAGLTFKFVTSQSFSTNYVITPLSGDLIQGTLIVSQTPVACSNETALNIVGSAETVSDWVELTATSTSGWLITGSTGDASGAYTCTGG